MNVLYVGTDNGAYVSVDRGQSWHPFSEGLPNVAVHDLIVHPDASELVLGTHGRSIYKADVSMLQAISADVMNSVVIKGLDPINHSRRWGASFGKWYDAFEPEVTVDFYSPAAGKATVTITNAAGVEVQRMQVQADKGFNTMNYDLSMSSKAQKALSKDKSAGVYPAQNGKYYLPKGDYTITIKAGGSSASSALSLK